MAIDSAFITTDEAARLLGLKPSSLCKWRVQGGGPPFYKVGNRAVRYLASEVLAYGKRFGRAYSTSEAAARPFTTTTGSLDSAS